MGLTTVFLTVVYFMLMYLTAPDCSTFSCCVLEGIVHGWGTDYQTVLNSAILGPPL